ncbi:MAG TPA: ABC transporter permease [Ramlibacter sp.]|jgi:putative ABC transport system permease protein|uniref:ABC transporter permease n=1 Tax=Ramlibacter sp. TaxID=1917967 RepID=UPI002D748007|nr:ABC transporter permease [Ramlibacter sp.]HZY20203.1 ABC transporter permease [Ramlibacter sp.]
MNLAALSLRYLWSRPLQAVLNLLLLSLGLASITFVMLASAEVERTFQRDLAGIDAVVGAKGSPMQLILSGVFQIDVAPGNVKLAEVQALARHPLVAQVIPISMGDSVAGFRILGTTPEWLGHYRLAFAQGQPWSAAMQAVVGAQVAQATGWHAGSAFHGSHGLGGGDEHAQVYRVTGVLAPCGCVADRLVLTSLESVWDVHEKHGAAPTGRAPAPGGGVAAAHPGHDADEAHDDREVTMALVRYRTPLAAVSFPRLVNASTGMQAAAPALEVSRLLRMLGVGSDVLRGIGAVLLLTATLSVFIALWNAVRERRADLAMLRMLGTPPRRVAGLLVCEALWLALFASVLGLAAGHGLMVLVGSLLASRGTLPLSGAVPVAAELWIPLAAAGAALLAALLPAWGAYRVDAAQLLNSR